MTFDVIDVDNAWPALAGYGNAAGVIFLEDVNAQISFNLRLIFQPGNYVGTFFSYRCSTRHPGQTLMVCET